MILQFKVKIKDGQIRRPELKPRHVTHGGPYNDLTLKMALRRFYRNNPQVTLPKAFSVNDLPECVTVDGSDFLATVTIEYPGV